ncbi:MAG TPA: site-specific integrase [Myxococcota bacterium]|nr:site-specific integrase [Myxococcota bacterium]
MGLFKRVPTPRCQKQGAKKQKCGRCAECKRYREAVWWMSFTAHGVQHRKSTETVDEVEAGEKLAEARKAARHGLSVDEEKLKLTVDGLFRLWLDHARAVGKKSLEADQIRSRLLIQLLGGARLLLSLRPVDIEKLRTALEGTQTRLGRPMSPASVNRHLALLRSAVNYAGRNGYVHRDAVRGLAMAPEHNVRDRLCTPDEYQRLIEKAEPRLRLAIVFGYMTGMRLGEITNLRWADVDAKAGTIHVRSQTSKSGEGRKLPLPPVVAAELKSWPASIDPKAPIFLGQRYRRRKPGAEGNGAEKRAEKYVGIVGSNTLSPAFSRLCRDLGIEDLRFHDLRHTFATRLRRHGVDLFTASKALGHKTLTMTRRYNTIDTEDLRAAMAGGALACGLGETKVIENSGKAGRPCPLTSASR